MSLRSQFESILVPKQINTFIEYTLTFTILRYTAGSMNPLETKYTLPAVPGWFTLYEVKVLLWDTLERNPIYAPPLLFMCVPSGDTYEPLEIAWSTVGNEPIDLINPILRMTGEVDERFIDSAGREKTVNQNNRTRMTLNDVFELDTRTSELPEIQVFVYADCIDRIVSPKPLGERDAYGRIIPYFPFLDASNLPTSTSTLPTLSVLLAQTDQVVATLAQVTYLETLLKEISGKTTKVPRLEGIQLLRWVWDKVPQDWEGSALVFFGTKVTADRPYMRLYPTTGQPLVKILVKGMKDRPVPDIADSRLFTSWKEEKITPSGKDCLYIKLRMNETNTLYSTMRVFNDGTADLIIQPPKRKRILDPYSEVGEAPTLLETVLADMPYKDLVPRIAQVSAVFKLYKHKSDYRITHAGFQSRLKAFSSLFQEIPPLPNEQPLIMLRFKGVSNFTNETRIFSFLTQNAENDMLEGESDDEGLTKKVMDEFRLSEQDARKQIAAWITQRGEFTLAVSDTKDYILNKNPGVDIAIYEQHPVYTFHMYSDQNSKTYSLILHLLGILMDLPSEAFTTKRATQPAAAISMSVGGAAGAPAAASVASPTPPDSPDGYDDGAYPEFLMTIPEEAPEEAPEAAEAAPEASEGAAVEQVREAAFERPSDVNSIKLTQYYIERLAQVDPALFNYEKPAGGRGYVSHCAANEGRQPIVLDSFEFDQMRAAYAADTSPTGDMEILLYPDDLERAKRVSKGYSQPTLQDDTDGTLGGKPFPSPTNKEYITVVKYGSKKDKVKYYICPRLFCIRDRILVRYKDFKGTVDKEGNPKPAFTCPFISSQGSPCRGTLLSKEDVKHDKREGNKTILQRITTRESDRKRSIFSGFLSKQKTPDGLYLPCCFTDETDKTLFKKQDPELSRLGLISQKPMAQPIADAIVAATAAAPVAAPVASPVVRTSRAAPGIPEEKYEPNYYRVLQGASVKSLVDANKIPLTIVPPLPKKKKNEEDQKKDPKKDQPDPKAGPQIGFIPQVLDEYFMQDSKSDQFAERNIIKLLKPTAQGFLRLGIDNSNPNQSVLTAIAAYNYQPNVKKFIESVFDNPKFSIFQSIPPRKFIEINAGNLVHEFYGRYTFDPVDPEDPIASKYINMNDMRKWAHDNLGITQVSSANIPAIERIMNSYRCFTTYILKLKEDPTVRADLRTFYDILCEPTIMLTRGILFIILELTVEDIIVKTDKPEFKTEVKLDRVRCPSYPLNHNQQQADIGFLIHYTRITKDRTKPSGKSYTHMAWEPLFYVDGIHQLPDGRHKPTMFFQRSEEASWPPIVKQRVSEFFEQCTSINRGPFTSMFTIDPNSLIASNELITAVRVMPSGIIRDSYNHLVGVAYKIPGQGIAAVPVMDDASRYSTGKLYLDWDDFKPAPVDKLIDFYKAQIVNIFPQYKGYEPKYLARSRLSGKIEGLMLENDILVPADEPVDQDTLKQYDINDIDEIEWNLNNTIAYDIEMRRTAFQHAKVGQDLGDPASISVDPKDKEYLKLDYEGSEDDIEDIYQHLRLSFSNWLDTEAGREIRARLETVLRSSQTSLYDKRKQVDILLYSTIKQWLEPNTDDIGSKADMIGFLRVDCLVQGKESCSGRCKWVPRVDAGAEGVEAGSCKIHMPRPQAKGTVIHFPKLLYIRLVDELIRYTSKRNEIFDKSVPRLTVRREAQRQGDQYIIPEGTSAWKTWWEHLRSDWLTPDEEESLHFDEQYEPIPSGLLEAPEDTRTLPETLVNLFGAADPKTSSLIWNPSTVAEKPFFFLRSVIRNDSITGDHDITLDATEVKTISLAANTQVLYIKNDTGGFSGAIRSKVPGATRAIIIVTVAGVPGWISQKGSYDVKIPFLALPAALNMLK